MFGSTRKILSLFAIWPSIFLNAQTQKIEATALLGYHFATNVIDKTGESLNGSIKGLELGFGKLGIGKPSYQAIYGSQKAMLNFKFIQLNNPDTFGYSLGILPAIYLPIKIKQHQALRFKVSYGLNFNSKQFSKENNFDNRAISSPINFGLDLGLDYELKHKTGRYLLLSSGVYHISNGSLKMPNGGINLMYLKAGIGLTRNADPEKFIPHQYTLPKRYWHYLVYGFASHREYNYFANLDRFWVFGINQQIHYQLNHLYAIGLGIDLHYDATQSLTNADGKKLYQVNEYEKYMSAIGLSQQFRVGKIFLPLGIYSYILPLHIVKEPIYIRFGLGYQFHKHWFIGGFFKGTVNGKGQLKSDFMEWSLGYRFFNDSDNR
jgi:hypothetical protein